MDIQNTTSPSQPRSSKRLRGSETLHDTSRGGQVAHTLTACCRCRHRKTRCDAGLPRCGPCERNNAVCEYFDAAKGKKMPREYVIILQNKVRHLEKELASFAKECVSDLDVEGLVRGAGLVKIKENDDDLRFLGPSSGIAMTRLVMELAKDLCSTKSIKEIVPEKKAQEIRQRFANESSKPTSKVYPMISSVAAPDLPSEDLTHNLIENFNIKVQSMYPVLHEPSFYKVVRDVYQGSRDDYKNFTVRIVIAISMQKLDPQYAGLADSYYLAALSYLENTIRAMDLGTLQCFSLIAMYSMTTPTRTAAYWVVGLATKLCQELRMTDEATIACDMNGNPLSVVEADMRRRLYWICSSTELGLAHSLGRPSAFGTTHDHSDISPFLIIDDEYITPVGVKPGSPHSLKKQTAMHFMKMRLLQLEIRRTLYMNKRQSPTTDDDPWFSQMEVKINNWMSSSPRSDGRSGLSETWFRARSNTMVIFLYRPSPQVPKPSMRGAQLCFEAATYNISIQRQQIENKSVDLTWIFTQSLFMATNTLLWSLSYSEIRREHPRVDVEKHLQIALDAIYFSSKKWPGVESALELYIALAEACLKAYNDPEASYGVGSPSNKASAASPHSIDTPPSSSTPSTVHSTPALSQHTVASTQSPPFNYTTSQDQRLFYTNVCPTRQANGYSLPNRQDVQLECTASEYAASSGSESIIFDPRSFSNPLPSPLTYGYGRSVTNDALDRDFLLGAIGDQYAQYLRAHFIPEPMDGLNLEQQSELMNTLEANGISGFMRGASSGQGLNSTSYSTEAT